jgi:hypothetical protein
MNPRLEAAQYLDVFALIDAKHYSLDISDSAFFGFTNFDHVSWLLRVWAAVYIQLIQTRFYIDPYSAKTIIFNKLEHERGHAHDYALVKYHHQIEFHRVNIDILSI